MSQGNIQKVMALIDTGVGCLPPQEYNWCPLHQSKSIYWAWTYCGDKLSKPTLELRLQTRSISVQEVQLILQGYTKYESNRAPQLCKIINMKQYRLLGGQEENTTIQERGKVWIIRPTHSPVTPLCGQLNRELETYHCVLDLPIHSLAFPLLMNHKTNFRSHWSVGSGPFRFYPKGMYIYQPSVTICGL